MKNPRQSIATPPTADSAAWEAFAGVTAVVNDRPDRYFCRSCGSIWSARGPVDKKGAKSYKPGAAGFNRCSHCGCRYFADDLLKLAKPSDKFVHLLVDGIIVNVDRGHLPAVWSQYRSERNALLAAEQGVNVATLPMVAAVVPATTTTAPVESTTKPSTAVSTEADWSRWAEMRS